MSDYSDFERMANYVDGLGTHSQLKGMVYLVDDEPDIVDILSGIIQGAGIQTKVFTDPLEVLRSFNECTPDLVISDIRMPGMTGMELLSQMRLINSDVPLVFVSGYLETRQLIQAIASGVYGAIMKPFNEEDVLRVCIPAILSSQAAKDLSQSINLLVLHFEELKDQLSDVGHNHLLESFQTELQTLLKSRRKLQTLSKK
jgi:hypothetical protein